MNHNLVKFTFAFSVVSAALAGPETTHMLFVARGANAKQCAQKVEKAGIPVVKIVGGFMIYVNSPYDTGILEQRLRSLSCIDQVGENGRKGI